MPWRGLLYGQAAPLFCRGICDILKKEQAKRKGVFPMSGKKDQENGFSGSGIAIGMCLGLSLGTAIGSATGNIGLWLPLGLSIGMCLGLAFDSMHKKHPEDENAPDEKEKEEQEETPSA